MNLQAIALQGFAQAEAQLETAAANLAGAGATPSAGPELNLGNTASQIVAMTSSEIEFELNVATLRTADQIESSTLDITA